MSLRLTTDGAIATLLIDRPDKRNAFDHAMWDALPRLIDAANVDPAVRVIVLRSAVDGVFCAGADIGELLAHKDDARWRSQNQAAIARAQHILTRSAKPTIGFIDGDCVGGGTGLALACDVRIATGRARIAITPANLGLVYPLHDTKLLVDLVGPGQAKRILFGAELLPAAEALRIGLIEYVDECPDRLAQLWASKSADSIAAIKRFVRQILEGQAGEDDASRAVFAAAFEGPDFLEGSRAFLARRKPQFG